MKKSLFAIIMLTSALMLVSCYNSTNPNTKRGSSGKTLEVLVVADNDLYCGSVKDSILAILQQPQECLNQPEQCFDVVNVPESSLKNSDMFKTHRNLIMIHVADTNKNVVKMANDYWAQPQIMFDFKLSSRDSVAPFLRRYMPIIKKEVRKCEHPRILRAYKSIENYELMQKLRNNFGFEITVSNEYYLCKMNPGFAWLRKETQDMSIGFIISTLPYKKSTDFEQATILDNLDSSMKNIPGPVDSSYMSTERRVESITQRVEFNDLYCVETRGLWRLRGKGFLGGPFVNYTILAPDGENLIMLTGYVMAPGKNKRDYLMQAESICYTLYFPEDKQ